MVCAPLYAKHCALEPVPLLQVLPLGMYSSCLFFLFFLSVRFAALTGMRLENWWLSFGALLVWCATGLSSLRPRQTPVWMCVPGARSSRRSATPGCSWHMLYARL